MDGPTVATSAAEGRATAATNGQFAGALGDAASARARLFEAEFRRAAWTAAYMGAMAVAAALLAVTAWLVFAGALVYAAVSAGAPWWIGAVVVIAAHIARCRVAATADPRVGRPSDLRCVAPRARQRIPLQEFLMLPLPVDLDREVSEAEAEVNRADAQVRASYGVLKQRFRDRLPWLVGAGIGIADLPAAAALA